MRALATNLSVENETRVFLESLDFEIKMIVSQKSGVWRPVPYRSFAVWLMPYDKQKRSYVGG